MCPGINSFASSAQPIANYVPWNQQSRGFKHRHHRRLVGSTKVVSGPVEGYTEGIWVAHTWRCLPCVRPEAGRRDSHTSQEARCMRHPRWVRALCVAELKRNPSDSAVGLKSKA